MLGVFSRRLPDTFKKRSALPGCVPPPEAHQNTRPGRAQGMPERPAAYAGMSILASAVPPGNEAIAALEAVSRACVSEPHRPKCAVQPAMLQRRRVIATWSMSEKVWFSPHIPQMKV